MKIKIYKGGGKGEIRKVGERKNMSFEIIKKNSEKRQKMRKK